MLYWQKLLKENNACNQAFSILVGPQTKENFERKFYRQCKLAGPQQREFRKEILQTMQVGAGPQHRS
ncbi:hypothetical protein BA765_12520 [Staphylococcus aureus]|nr:hypothetical protein BA765_12520 [Staphylococcus aureus]